MNESAPYARLDGKVAVVTGAARGQGRSHAIELAKRGARVVLADIADQISTVPYALATRSDLDETASLIREATGTTPLVQPTDIRRSADVDDLVSATLQHHGRLDILIANAGICGFAKFQELTDEMWEDMIAVNLTGTFKCMRAAIVPMMHQRFGRIVVTSSMSGRRGSPNLAHYCASKWGVIGLVKTLAIEARNFGVTVNAICPSSVDTPMVHNPAFYGLFASDVETPTRELVEPRYRTLNVQPVPWVEPEEVTKAVIYLVTAADYVTGSVLDVAAGGTAEMGI